MPRESIGEPKVVADGKLVDSPMSNEEWASTVIEAADNVDIILSALRKALRSKRGRDILASASNAQLSAAHTHLCGALHRLGLANYPLGLLRPPGITRREEP